LQAVALGVALLQSEIELLTQYGACVERIMRTPP
jgi:hypothetical protein